MMLCFNSLLTWFIVSHLVLVILTILSFEGYDNYSDTGGVGWCGGGGIFEV
jgi:hypothetical protein